MIYIDIHRRNTMWAIEIACSKINVAIKYYRLDNCYSLKESKKKKSTVYWNSHCERNRKVKWKMQKWLKLMSFIKNFLTIYCRFVCLINMKGTEVAQVASKCISIKYAHGYFISKSITTFFFSFYVIYNSSVRQ